MMSIVTLCNIALDDRSSLENPLNLPLCRFIFIIDESKARFFNHMITAGAETPIPRTPLSPPPPSSEPPVEEEKPEKKRLSFVGRLKRKLSIGKGWLHNKILHVIFWYLDYMPISWCSHQPMKQKIDFSKKWVACGKLSSRVCTIRAIWHLNIDRLDRALTFSAQEIKLTGQKRPKSFQNQHQFSIRIPHLQSVHCRSICNGNCNRIWFILLH